MHSASIALAIVIVYYPRKFWWLHQHADYRSMCVWFALSRVHKTWSYSQFTWEKYIRQLIFAAWAWMWIIISHRVRRCWRSRHWFFPRADVTVSSTIQRRSFPCCPVVAVTCKSFRSIGHTDLHRAVTITARRLCLPRVWFTAIEESWSVTGCNYQPISQRRARVLLTSSSRLQCTTRYDAGIEVVS